jgi:hypothetical protein
MSFWYFLALSWFNISIVYYKSGDMFMKTTNNDTFTRHEGDNRVKRTTHSPTLKVGKALGKFENQTQSKRDFPQYRNPERAIPAEPAPCTIDLKFDNK